MGPDRFTGHPQAQHDLLVHLPEVPPPGARPARLPRDPAPQRGRGGVCRSGAPAGQVHRPPQHRWETSCPQRESSRAATPPRSKADAATAVRPHLEQTGVVWQALVPRNLLKRSAKARSREDRSPQQSRPAPAGKRDGSLPTLRLAPQGADADCGHHAEG